MGAWRRMTCCDAHLPAPSHLRIGHRSPRGRRSPTPQALGCQPIKPVQRTGISRGAIEAHYHAKSQFGRAPHRPLSIGIGPNSLGALIVTSRDRFRNRQRPFGLGRGNRSCCPKGDLCLGPEDLSGRRVSSHLIMRRASCPATQPLPKQIGGGPSSRTRILTFMPPPLRLSPRKRAAVGL